MSQRETFRRECEARHVLALPFHERKPYLNLVGKKRGSQAQAVLESEIKRQYEAKRVKP